MGQDSQPVTRKEQPSGLTFRTVVTTIVEMIPGGLGPWGVGDVVTAIEGVAGRTLDGLRLTGTERGIYLIASAIPVVPARPIIAVWRSMTAKK
ncbi:MAG TPA: hypothetical protein VHR15_01965 [Ktedonobacterales bacterium]|jgi:hypothetical protein|nr:hypothetical protein [Ktedonobacterales bacterium]